jgi:WD40 repeat protein
MACIGHTNRLQVLKSHPRGPSVLFTAGWDSTVQCWDLRTSKSQVHISGPKVFGGALDIARDRMLVGSHGRRWDALRVYDLRTGNSMAARRPRLTVGVLCGPLRPVVRPLLLTTLPTLLLALERPVPLPCSWHWNTSCDHMCQVRATCS